MNPVFDGASRWLALARSAALDAEAVARAAFLVAPDGFALAVDSLSDNHYMQAASPIDSDRAMRQHRGLQQALSACLPTVVFPGAAATPDAVFPNNVFACVRDETGGRLLIGRMRHPVRQREAERSDIPAFFRDLLRYRVEDLRSRPGLSELTGTLVIDRGRRIGIAGLSPRCDAPGVESMASAFGLRGCLRLPLAAGEYHTNVVLSVLASRALVICPEACADPAAVSALCDLYSPSVIDLSRQEQRDFAGNCIALDAHTVWMSERAADGLLPASRRAFERAGFAVRAVPLDEIERAGGSLRCCVAEIF